MNKWGHFKHLHFKTFLSCPRGLSWCFSTFPTKALNICNCYTSATPKVGVHLAVIGFHPLHSPPFVRMCLTLQHIFALMGPCILHLVMNLMLGLWHHECCRNPTLGKCEDETHTPKKWELGVLRDSCNFRAQQQKEKHLDLRCSLCRWKGLEV